MQVSEFTIKSSYFLDKTTVIYGESNTGKSCIIKDILYAISDHANLAIVMSPTDMQNSTYGCGLIPKPCIHYNISPELLSNIWDRQVALSIAHKKANREEVLTSLFDKIDNIEPIKANMTKIISKIDEVESSITDDDHARERISILKSDAADKISSIRKQYLIDNRATLLNRATTDEAFTLKYIGLNPRIVLIFDDCTDLLKLLKKDTTIQKLFYQGRHNYVTTIIACHTDVALPPDLKKNTFVSIFTEETCAKGFFERSSSNIDKEGKQRAYLACKQAFTQKHQKLIWVRDEKKFYKYTAALHPGFKFGGAAVWDFCDRCETTSYATEASNKFSGLFS